MEKDGKEWETEIEVEDQIRDANNTWLGELDQNVMVGEKEEGGREEKKQRNLEEGKER